MLLVTTCNRAGTWLVKQDAPVHADAMVVLMGSIGDRVLQAADLYQQKLAGKLIIVEENMSAYSALEARGAHIVSNSTQARGAAIALGIPADSIEILPGNARSTQQEALIIRDYLRNQSGIDTLLLVTSSPHTRRSSIIFTTAFNKAGLPVVVSCSPSLYTHYTGKGWWKHKEEIQAVLSEYIKLVNFWLFDRRIL